MTEQSNAVNGTAMTVAETITALNRHIAEEEKTAKVAMSVITRCQQRNNAHGKIMWEKIHDAAKARAAGARANISTLTQFSGHLVPVSKTA